MLKGVFDNSNGQLTAEGASAVSSQGILQVYFSGILFNRDELAHEGENDADTVARLYQEKGDNAFEQLNGPFAIAISDGKQLLLVRDQVGQKFLFFKCDGGLVHFSEELNEYASHAEKDWQALADYLSLGYVPAPRTAWKGVSKLRNGEIVAFRDGVQSARFFWSPSFETQAELSMEEAQDKAKALIIKAIRRCLAYDGQPGFLLSGGIDSNLLLGLTSETAPNSYKAFTVGFADPKYDERYLAGLSAKRADAQHITQQVEPSVFEEFLQMLKSSGEPFADSSLLPDYCAMKLAAAHCKSVFMGDGGDELFGGYRRYRIMALRGRLGEALSRLGGGIASAVAKLLPHASEGRTSLSTFTRLAKAMSLPPVPCYASFQELFSPCDVKTLAPELASQTESYHDRWQEIYDCISGVNGVNLIDMHYYLPDDGCRKEGIAASAAGVLPLAPILDMDVFRFVLQLPVDYKLNLRQGKLLLRQIGKDFLHPEITRQVKRGFGMPVASWLRSELKDYVLNLPAELESFGCFDRKAVETIVAEHLNGRCDHGARIWALLCLAQWK